MSLAASVRLAGKVQKECSRYKSVLQKVRAKRVI